MFLRRAGRKPDPETEAARERVRGWMREALGGAVEVSFTVSEIACGDQACGGVETVVLVMWPGRPTEAVKLRGPMTAATWPAVLDAVSARPEIWP